MAGIIGIGGVFFKSQDPEALRKWYLEKLGINSEAWGSIFPFRKEENGYQVWCPFKADTTYFSPGTSSFMINFRVEDLDGFLQELQAKKVELAGTPESGEYGKFAWVMDPDGNKIELWEPPVK